MKLHIKDTKLRKHFNQEDKCLVPLVILRGSSCDGDDDYFHHDDDCYLHHDCPYHDGDDCPHHGDDHPHHDGDDFPHHDGCCFCHACPFPKDGWSVCECMGGWEKRLV